MIAHQFKTVGLSLLLLGGTVATGVGLASSRLPAGPAGGNVNQSRPVAAAPPKSRSNTSAAQAAVRKTESGSSSVSRMMDAQLGQDKSSFIQLLARFFSELTVADIRQLHTWSQKTLEADEALAATHADHVAAYAAHRDRMKRLVDLFPDAPASDTERTVNELAWTTLAQAEADLKSITKSPGTPGVPAMTKQVGEQSRPTGGTASIAVPARGRNGEVASGGGGEGVMKNGATTVLAEAKPAEIQPAKEEKPHESAKATQAKGQTPTKTATQPAQQPTRSGPRGQMVGAGMATGTGGMGGGMVGMGGGRGLMGAMGPGQADRMLRRSIAASAAGLAMHETNPQSKAILKKLEMSISMPFNEENSLEEVLKYIKQSTATGNEPGIPIYVDPKGLKDAEASLQSPVKLDLEGVPLKTTFRLILKQIGLAYCVRDGVLIVSSVQGIAEELQEAQSELQATDPVGGFTGGFDGGMGGGALGGNQGGMM